MKNKYQRMNKEEKKELIGDYKKTEFGKNYLFRLKRLLIIGIVGIAFAILEFLVAYFNKDDIWDYISSGLLLIISIVFIIGSIRLKGKQLNKYALKRTK